MPNLARIPPSPPKSGFYEGCAQPFFVSQRVHSQIHLQKHPFVK